MAKFCKNCGKMLEDGAVCDCTQAAAPVAPETPVEQPAPVYVAPEAPAAPAAPKEGIGTFFKKIWALFVAFMKKPIDTASAFVNNCDYKTALSIIGIHAVAVALLLVTYAAEYNGIIMESSGAVSGMSREAARMIERAAFPTWTIFFVSAIATFGVGCLLAAVLMLLVKIFKKETTYKYMLCASAMNSLAITPFVLVAVLCGLLFSVKMSVSSIIWAMVVPMVVGSIGVNLGTYVTLGIVPAGSSATKDNMPYIMFIAGIVMAILLYIVLTICVPMCLPEIMQDADSLMEALEGIFERIF